MFAHKCGYGGNYGIEELEGEFFFNSCCGGCYALKSVVYCPGCGEKIKAEDLIAVNN